jgi:transcriptional regulator with XRE-family HTH domain
MVRIQELRTMAGLTQFRLAKQSGVGRTRLSLAECGYIELRREEYEALEHALADAIRRRMLEFQEVLKRQVTDGSNETVANRSSCPSPKPRARLHYAG